MEAPFLGCSPDGLVGDGLTEIKCPYSTCNSVINPTTVPYTEVKNERLVLRNSHEYYFQVMGALLCTERKWCDFVVWTFKDMKVVRVFKNEQFMSNVKEQLKDFFSDCFQQILLDKHLYRESHTFLKVTQRM